MLRFKIWLLNLKRIETADESFKALVSGVIHGYDYYKLYGRHPEHHMMYSSEYLNKNSMFELLWKNYQYESFFKRMVLMGADYNG